MHRDHEKIINQQTEEARTKMRREIRRAQDEASAGGRVGVWRYPIIVVTVWGFRMCSHYHKMSVRYQRVSDNEGRPIKRAYIFDLTVHSRTLQANNRVALARMDCDQIVTKIKKKNQQLLER